MDNAGGKRIYKSFYSLSRMHNAVVVKDSSKNNPNVNVVPLTSLEDGEEDKHKERVFLGLIEGLNQKNAMAIPDQMGPISKIRKGRRG